MRRFFLIICITLLNAALVWPSALIRYGFEHETDAKRFQSLTETLRCVVCHNQNLAESNADIANDLKDVIYRAIQEGKTDALILSELKNRYGNFILFKPPLEPKTWGLWWGPWLLFMFGCAILIKTLRRT